LLEFERLVQQDFGLTASAFRMVVEALRRNTVQAVAVGAGDEEWVGHEGGPVEKPITAIWRRLLIFSIVRCRSIKLG
jgi:hypothetical protein